MRENRIIPNPGSRWAVQIDIPQIQGNILTIFTKGKQILSVDVTEDV